MSTISFPETTYFANHAAAKMSHETIGEPIAHMGAGPARPPSPPRPTPPPSAPKGTRRCRRCKTPDSGNPVSSGPQAFRRARKLHVPDENPAGSGPNAYMPQGSQIPVTYGKHFY
ncbi:hypothetical protein TWF718_002610 [Orbilia javanica]|uniref:Uncharacterized protein n=1 Tax=Orbilia javanica TaxID=47235 RepID=A0AAN8MG68_9PEZI